ncbi:MAG: hypothetical protein R8P61_29475 [Bacteroidia bacterium]|nr:hypothetical protein [Bacteroidia bacterium]
MKFDKRTYLFMGTGVGLILVFYFIALLFPGKKQVDWRENFEGDRKEPYGSYLLKNSLADLYELDSVIVKEASMFELMALQEQKGVSMFLMNNKVNSDYLEVEEMMLFAERGNHLFIAAREFPYYLGDTLNFVIKEYSEEQDSIQLRLSEDSELQAKFPSYGMNYLIPGMEKELEVLVEDEQGNPTMIKYLIGKGSLTISTTPRIYCNYYMVQDSKREFISTALSQFPVQEELWWDEYYKKNKFRFRGSSGGGGGENSVSTMDYIFSQEGLKWAFWLSLLALAVYAIFESKRKQRIIPVIEPLPNLTLDFTETVGRLYFKSSAHKEIAEKRVRALLAYIREHYFLKTDKFDEKFLASLSAKSNISLKDVRVLFRSIERIRNAPEISESQLIEINQSIDNFYSLGAR